MAKSFSEIPLVDVSLFDAAYMTGELSSVMARAAMEYGPIFRWVAAAAEEAGQMRVSMIGPEANRFAMHTNRHYFSHDLGWTPLVSDTFGKGLLNMDDPDHAVHRKMWNPAFASAYMGAYLPVMQRVIEERTARWPERDEIDLYAEAREITFDIAAAALAGFNTGEQVDHLRTLFYALMHGFNDSDGTFEEQMARYMEIRNELIYMLVGMIHQRRNAQPEEWPRDVLSLIVHAKGPDNGQTLSDEQVLGHLNILLLAGHETTTTLSTWALYLLSIMPEHRARIMNEMNAQGMEKGNGQMSIEAIRSLKNLDYFVRETGRMYPPVINVPRGVLEEFEFGGYTVPAGTQVRLSLGGCHYLPDVFENPLRFDPARFAPPREEDKRTAYSLVTFGGGPRVCIGQHFALIETRALIAHVLSHYNMKPLEGQHPVHVGFFNAFIPGGIRMRVVS